MMLGDPERLRLLGEAAAATIEPGMRIGLGTGSTADAVIRALGQRVAGGLEVTGVATSERTRRLASSLGIRLVELDDVDELDLGIDGADEIDPNLNLIKGRGGALLHEKLVAITCARFLIVAASEKLVDRLGSRVPIPVEIVPLGWPHTRRRLASLGLEGVLRTAGESDATPFRTDDGHYIVDCATGPIHDPVSLASAIKEISGVIDHGLFIDIATQTLTIDPAGAISRGSQSD